MFTQRHTVKTIQYLFFENNLDHLVRSEKVKFLFCCCCCCRVHYDIWLRVDPTTLLRKTKMNSIEIQTLHDSARSIWSEYIIQQFTFEAEKSFNYSSRRIFIFLICAGAPKIPCYDVERPNRSSRSNGSQSIIILSTEITRHVIMGRGKKPVFLFSFLEFGTFKSFR